VAAGVHVAVIPLDLLSPAFEEDTTGAYNLWRREWDAKFFPAHDVCVVIGYEAAVSILKDTTRFSSSVFEPLTSPLLHAADPPAHTELRRAVAPFFTPSRQAAAGASLSRIVSEAAKSVQQAGKLRVLADFAEPIPLDFACEWFGIEPDVGAFLLTEGAHDARWKNVRKALVDGGVFAEMHKARVLPPEKLAQLAAFFMSAAVTTTRDFLWLALRTLALNPAAIALCSAESGSIDGVVDELLRLEPPAHALMRRTRGDVNVAGYDLGRGAIVWISLAAANRDPKVFARADEIIPGRTGPRHLSFGNGPHFCLGSHIGKMIAAEALYSFLPLIRTADLANGIPPLRFDRRTRLPIMWNPTEWEIPVASAS
jgi:cytochrome P450